MPAKIINIDQARTRKSTQSTPATSPTEIQSEFDDLYQTLASKFGPVTPDADHWIREAAAASIMRLKLTELETSVLNASLRTLVADPESHMEHLTPTQRMAIAWGREAQSGNLEKIYQQTERADNQFHRAIRKLMRLRRSVA